jgi:mannan endo-1,4-beta-mannosidase
LKAISFDLSFAAKLSVRRLLAATVAAGLVAGTSAVMPAQTTTAEAATTNQIYWGSYINGGPWDTSLIDAFEARAGKKQSIIHWGQAWKNGPMMSFPASVAEKMRLRGAIPLINWNSWNLNAQVDDPNFKLSVVYGGAYDAYITQWAKDAKAWGHPFFLRFNHEMNGWWYPWSEQRNGNQPGDYVKAWRHVVDIFRKVGADNVTWVWCPNIDDAQATPMAEMYPGDDYVDWVGIDGYNKATGRSSFLSWDQVFGLHPWTKKNTYDQLVKLAPSKPMMIAETATSNKGGDAEAWIKDALLTQIPTKYTHVKALVWFNWNAKDRNLTWPIESSQPQIDGFHAGITSDYYASNTFANLPPGPVQPLSPVSNTPAKPGTPTKPSPTPTVPASPTPAPAGPTTSVTLKANGDTFVDSQNPASTAGGPSKTLVSDGDPSRTAYLRFDLSSLAGKTITSASLRVHTTNDVGAGSVASFDIMYVPNSNWNGSSINLNNAMAISTTKLGSLVSPSANLTWYQAGLSAAAVQSSAGSQISMALLPVGGNPDGVIFNSKEGDPTLAPQLVVTYR